MSLLSAPTAVPPARSIRGLNWADTRDNFQAGVLYPSGLGPADTHVSAAAIADRVIGRLYSLTGGNTVRMPINEATVSGYWDTYTGAIDTALTRGRVIICYWPVKAGRPQDAPAFVDMWAAVLETYGTRTGVYFEPINEPSGYRPGPLNDFYCDWLARFPSVPRSSVILDGSGYAQRPVTVGRDRRLEGCLLGYHEYAFFSSQRSESAWQAHVRKDVGEYHHRTVCTEFGASMIPGLEYDQPSSDEFVRYLRAITAQFRAWGMGSVYWPGVRDGDNYALCARSGSGPDIDLSVNNPSGLALIQHGWGDNPTLRIAPQLAAPGIFRRLLGR